MYFGVALFSEDIITEVFLSEAIILLEDLEKVYPWIRSSIMRVKGNLMWNQALNGKP